MEQSIPYPFLRKSFNRNLEILYIRFSGQYPTWYCQRLWVVGYVYPGEAHLGARLLDAVPFGRRKFGHQSLAPEM